MLKRKPGRAFILLLLLTFCKQAIASPFASFTAGQTSGCLPFSVQFTNTSTGAVSWYWDLGNGNSSTIANPTNVYTVAGNYTIKLIAYDGSGNADTATYINYISVVGKPTAGFYSNITSACPDNNLFSFTNSSSGGAVSYLWDFGDGTTSTQSNPTHSYLYAGVFTVTLIATNTFGCQDVKILNQYITIYPKPDAAVQASSTVTCDPTTVFQFSNNTQNGISWNWSFGDNTWSNLQNPSHTFPGQGNYLVSLIVTDIHGCMDTTENNALITVGFNNWADFTNDVDSGCSNLTVNFSQYNSNLASILWSFGDGNTSTQTFPTHTYTAGGVYTVTLIVTTTTGCADTVIKNNLISVGTKPDVDFQFSNSTGCSPLAVQFTNTSVNFTSCKWFFGDGTSSTAINPTHVYTNSGTYTVTLQCWGPTGCTKTLVRQNIVTVKSANAIFNASNRVGCPPLQTNFTSYSSSGTLSYFWDLGDGTTSTQANPVHTYTTSGNFTVTLIVTDALGCSDTEVRTNYIQTVNSAASYIPPPTTTGCIPLTAQFTDATSGSGSWNWDFGDGTTSTLQNPTHIYTTPGLFTVSLTTTSPGGNCTQTINNFSTFNVNSGYAGFTHTASPCPPYVASFQDTSMNAVSWFWDFGDGTTDTSQNPVHTFLSPGYHSVSLTITTAGGCTYTTMQSNSVYFPPFGANFYGITLDTIYPRPVQFYANSVGATNWWWNFGDGGSSTLEDPLHLFQNPGFYGVTLTISNGICTLFYDPPPFDFGLPDTTGVNTGNGLYPEEQKGCAPLNVLFTNDVAGAISWFWEFGDSSTSNVEFPYHVYYDPGIYSVTLTTTDTLGIVQVLQMDSIVLVSGPRPGFIVSQPSACSNTQISITDTSLYAVAWNWDLGDGSFDTVQNPVHTYNTALSNYIITQVVTDTMGCSASLSTSFFSSFLSPLVASDYDICGNDTVNFFTSLQNFMTYTWNFGDGQTSMQMNPSHVYASEGIYTVSLTVTDFSGCSQTFIVGQPINVKIPIASFSTSSSRQGCNEITVAFANTSSNAQSYQWNMGDGNIITMQDPVYTYNQAGVFDVTLTVFSGTCSNTVHYPQYIRVDTAHADFVYTTNQKCVPVTATYQDLSVNPVSWRWYFGDGDSASVQNPVHIYTIRPCCFPQLIMTDNNGCVDTMSVPALSVIKASYTTSSDSICFPSAVQFNNTSSVIVDTWYWDFGDGTTSTLQNPSHTYSQPGTYDVMLVVKASYLSCTDTLFTPAKIIVRNPFADFFSTDIRACAPSLVNFTNLSVDADNFLWDFGNGATSTNTNPSHIYNNPGIYTVQLTAYSNLGCADSITRTQYIQVLGPTTNFTASAYEGCFPFEVQFTDHSINANGYSWNFGDGNSDFTINPSHIYSDTGSFTVSLVTTDTSGCISYFELPQQVVIHPSPSASFTVSDISGCQPFNTIFTNTSTGYQNLLWFFGDGDTSSAENPGHSYPNAGLFDAQLIAYNGFGCADTAIMSQPIEVYPVPIPNFTVNDAIGCSPFHVTFNNTSSNLNGPQYLWDFGNGYTSSDSNPSFDFISPGSYTVGLTVTNLNGCSSSISYSSMIHIRDTIPPRQTTILSVSVESNSSVKIIWENVADIDLAAYVIYRSDAQMNYYREVYRETNIQNTNFLLTSEYTDNGLNTLAFTYSYKVLALDTCGNGIPLSQLTAHTTINISSMASGNDILVSWTPYDGCPVSSYQLYRAAPGESFSYQTTLAPSTFTYIDTNFICPLPYSYRVIATDLCGNTYTSKSDTSVTQPLNILEGQIVDVIRSTVIENEYVLTEWNQPLVHPEMVTQFEIYRSTDKENYAYLNSVPALQTDYLDRDVDVQNKHYYYKILVLNTCNISEDLSGLTSTIILKGEMNEARRIHLGWTPYEGWASGVEYYILKRDDQGHWQVLRQINGNILMYEYHE